jgi:hypothetical protein
MHACMVAMMYVLPSNSIHRGKVHEYQKIKVNDIYFI